ncbi:MAG: phosphoribosylaminoimidazolesuccinocarboxamide synthase [Dehalococcoidia bacterium]|nr:phosphoribosylaminoimidazolesuccinocarboxamide synthase [Dehalococcoidia bacterium]
MDVVLETSLPNRFARGKVRDTYDLGDRLLIIATDRISAFDVVLPSGIPYKGAVLTQLSAFWFEKTGDVVPNHFIKVIESTDDPDLPFSLPRELVGRAMLVRKAERVDVECVARGYITGSGWSDYLKSGSVSGIKLPGGLIESQRLPQVIFTPTTKADAGHDMPMTYQEVEEFVSKQAANVLRLRTLSLYQFMTDYALERGIILADTKFEFGYLGDELIVIDEVGTPDSSRFWPAAGYEAGRPQPSFDKQFVRDWLSNSGWNKEPPAPELPPDIVQKTAEKYVDAFERLTGKKLLLP